MSTELEAAELLEKSAEILETGGWCQWFLESGTRRCAVGAMLDADGIGLHEWGKRTDWQHHSVTQSAMQHLLKSAEAKRSDTSLWDSVVQWNNHEKRTASEVIDAMKLAAKDLRNQATP